MFYINLDSMMLQVTLCFEQIFSVQHRRMLAANKFSPHRVAVRVNLTIAAGFESPLAPLVGRRGTTLL